ncbi:MAG: MarR family transcriptional regulator [Tepidisphaeraceae bacterium]
MSDAHSVSPLTCHLGYWMRMVSNQVSHRFSVKVEAHGVTVAEWVVMRELLRLGEVSPSQLAEVMGMTRGAISKLIERLVIKRFIRRTSAGKDKRCQSITLTNSGQALVPVLARLADQNDEEFFGHLTIEQRSALLATLQQVARLREQNVVPID